MHDLVYKLTSWRDAAFVTPSATAEILGYSEGHVRKLMAGGGLETVRLADRGPLFVTVPSLLEFIDGVEPVRPEQVNPAPRRPAPRTPTLRLVVDNT
jgi:hypothetical protein